MDSSGLPASLLHVAAPAVHSSSSGALVAQMPSQVSQIQHGGAVHAARWRATGVCAEDVSCPALIVPAVTCPRRCTAQPQPAARPGSRQRYCRCGKPLSGRAPKLNGTEVCKGCERDHYRGLPPVYKAAKLEAVPAAAAAAAPRPRPRVAAAESDVQVFDAPGVAHATRHAYAAASSVPTESAACALLQLQSDATMGVHADGMVDDSVVPPPVLIPLAVNEMTADAAIADSKSAGLLALRSAEIYSALRIAMAVQGDPATQPPSAVRGWLASRYIHQRLVVDEHTTAAVLYEAYSQSRVCIVRGFPGSYPPAYPSVSEVLKQPPPEETRRYAYNHHGSHVHYFLRTPLPDTPDGQRARLWWSKINLLPDTGIHENVSSGSLWSFISRRAQTLLHVDDADAATTQWVGKKLWILVRAEEAARQNIHPIHQDAMRDPTPQVHPFMAWQQCESFQWCILNEGDTIITPRDRLHAVCCIGDLDAVSCGVYCYIAGTPPLPKAGRGPDSSKKRKRSRSPPPLNPVHRTSILPVAQKAWEVAPSSRVPTVARAVMATLIDEGQPLRIAATKAGASVSTAQRWSKRLHETGSADDNPRSGRPRATSALEDAAIVRASELNHYASNKDIRHQLALSISEDTIGRRLDAAGLPSHFAAGKIHYTDEERRNRLSFARGYQHWTAEQWETVIFGDEVTLEGVGRKRHQRVRRPAGHRFDPEYTVHTQIYAPSQHLFACFCSRGPGFCAMYEGKLDGKALRRLLDRTLVQTAADYYDLEHGEEWWFVHDNSKPFKSEEVRIWLHNHGVHVIDFPARSPDLNPIENVWPRVHKLTDRLHPTTNDALADAFIQCWPELSLDIFTDFAQSMPARIAAVIKANGHATKF